MGEEEVRGPKMASGISHICRNWPLMCDYGPKLPWQSSIHTKTRFGGESAYTTDSVIVKVGIAIGKYHRLGLISAPF